METETLDKLYLEWSQFTTAKTGKEIELRQMLAVAKRRIILGYPISDFDDNELMTEINRLLETPNANP